MKTLTHELVSQSSQHMSVWGTLHIQILMNPYQHIRANEEKYHLLDGNLWQILHFQTLNSSICYHQLCCEKISHCRCTVHISVIPLRSNLLGSKAHNIHFPHETWTRKEGRMQPPSSFPVGEHLLALVNPSSHSTGNECTLSSEPSSGQVGKQCIILVSIDYLLQNTPQRP